MNVRHRSNFQATSLLGKVPYFSVGARLRSQRSCCEGGAKPEVRITPLVCFRAHAELADKKFKDPAQIFTGTDFAFFKL